MKFSAVNELHVVWGIALLDKKVRVSLDKIIALLTALNDKGDLPLSESRKIVGDKTSHPVIIRVLERLKVIERYKKGKSHYIKLTELGKKVIAAYHELDKSIFE
ncbi:MAG: hypothetical protein ASUL_02754 [Candidatus Aramenus sulfurataquae]|uniref:ArnR1-like winged helix-turn-helix domain-containing protein n=1 Tax=Candidatus Aramenus sulfurataquae TaxID=1326980 RepID=W7KPB3_9CREN|nr:MAG: hypothetical protein ASUL_02754 [Candidatus Aramenus sulfurataquae]